MSDDIYYHQGIPSDLLTSDYADKRRLKVDDAALIQQVIEASVQASSINREILEQMKLLNARFEEAFNTKLNEGDL